MSRPLKIVIIAITLLIVILGAYLVTYHVATQKVSDKLAREAAQWGFTLDAQTRGAFAGPTCFDDITMEGPDNTHLNIHDACLTDGVLTWFTDTPNLTFQVGSVDGFLAWNALKTVKSLREKPETFEKAPDKPSLVAKLLATNASLSIQSLALKLGEPGKQLSMRSNNFETQLHDGLVQTSMTFSTGVDLSNAPVAIQNMPNFTMHATLDLHALLDHKTRDATGKFVEFFADEELANKVADALPAVKTAHPLNDGAILDVSFEAEPPLALGYVHKDQVMEAHVAQIDASVSHNKLVAALAEVSLIMPDLASIGTVSFERLTATAHDFTTKPKLDAITIVTPKLHVDIDKVVESKAAQEHPIFGTLVHFWKQDAGSIFGEAPKLSVRREDVKKAKPKIRKNPISAETLQAVHDGFKKFQKHIMSAPAIDIQNGRIEFSGKDSKFAFEAVSFNTAELFKDDQKFKLEFNIHNAKARFEVTYEGDSVFPTLSLNIDELQAVDFLKLLNMPIPEKSDGTFSGALMLSISEDNFKINGDVDFKQFAFFHEKVSPNVVHDINAAASLNVSYAFADDKIIIEPLSVTSGPITANGFIHVSNVRSNPVIEFEFGAKDVPCSDLPKAIPPGLLPTITDLQIAGSTFSPKLTGKIPWKDPLTSSLKETGFEGKCYPTVVEPHHPEEINDPHYVFTTNYTYFTDEIQVGPGTSNWTPLNDIPPYVRAAMFLTEDKRFFDHGPLRISFIERALRLNLNQRQYVYGGSTISQQLTKNLFLVRNKNLARKLEEAFVAWRMENVVPKSRIMELYINMIEFGPDVYGITQAAKFYFDKTPQELTPLEGAYLASLKIKPSQGGRFYKSGFPTAGWWPKRMKYIMKTLSENGYITAAEVLAAYPWVPQFVYPSPDKPGDFRNVWLRNFTEFLNDQARAKRLEEREKNQ